MHRQAGNGLKMTEYVKKFEVLKIIQEAMKKCSHTHLATLQLLEKELMNMQPVKLGEAVMALERAYFGTVHTNENLQRKMNYKMDDFTDNCNLKEKRKFR
nr:MAG TPA: hypothetical protein [Caudoviricetes sp.]